MNGSSLLTGPLRVFGADLLCFWGDGGCCGRGGVVRPGVWRCVARSWGTPAVSRSRLLAGGCVAVGPPSLRCTAARHQRCRAALCAAQGWYWCRGWGGVVFGSRRGALRVLRDVFLAQLGESGHLFAHAACSGEGCVGVGPERADEAGVVCAAEGDDGGEVEDVSGGGLCEESLGCDGVVGAVGGVVGVDDVVEVEQAMACGEDEQPVGL